MWVPSQLLPPELPRRGPPAPRAVLPHEELGYAQGQVFYRFIARVGVVEMAQVGAEGDAASLCLLCPVSGCRVLDEHELLASVMPSLCPLGHARSVPSCETALGKVPPAPPGNLLLVFSEVGSGAGQAVTLLSPVLTLLQDGELTCEERDSPHCPGWQAGSVQLHPALPVQHHRPHGFGMWQH